MRPQPAFILSLLTTGLLVCTAWIWLFPAYHDNDDVAIRLFMEGRIVPGAEPSGYFYFFNLGLGQLIAAGNRLWPSLAWFDVAEQSTLVLTTVLVLYCCFRLLRSYDDLALIILVAVMLLAVFAAIEFTIVGVLGTFVGVISLVLACTINMSKLECTLLSIGGATVFLIAALFRFEAAVLGPFVASLAGVHPIFMRVRTRALENLRRTFFALLLACVGVVLLWVYHFTQYFASPVWREFLQFNILLARIIDYAGSRASPVALEDAFSAAGWSMAEHQMIFNWMFFDPRVFSIEKMRSVVNNLPVVSELSPATTYALFSQYVRENAFVPFALVGVVLTSSGWRRTRIALGFLTGIIAVVILISVILKPLPHHVFWPMAAATLVGAWIIIHREQKCPPNAIKRVVAAVLLLGSCVPIFEQTYIRSTTVERKRHVALANIVGAQRVTRDTLVVFGAAFPFELVERPFGRPIIQHSIRIVPLGTTTRAPLFTEFFERTAKPDIGAWLCGDRTTIAVGNQVSLSVLETYYLRHRNQLVFFSPLFNSQTLNVYACHIREY